MTGMDIVVAALAAGAAAGLNGAASQAVQDTYSTLRERLRRHLSGDKQARRLLETDKADPSAWEAELGDILIASGAHDDEYVLATARHLLALTGASMAKSADQRPIVDLQDCKGVQVGHNNVQHIQF